MEEMIPQCKTWALNEVLSHKSLRLGGTLQNTLIRRIDGVIVPILAHIISFIDQNSNLALFSKQRGNPVGQLWLSIFRNSYVVQFKYGSIAKSKSSHSGDKFNCEMPFFWLIKETIEANIAGIIAHLKVLHYLEYTFQS